MKKLENCFLVSLGDDQSSDQILRSAVLFTSVTWLFSAHVGFLTRGQHDHLVIRDQRSRNFDECSSLLFLTCDHLGSTNGSCLFGGVVVVFPRDPATSPGSPGQSERAQPRHLRSSQGKRFYNGK